jgi:DNA-binding FadR family transcriptional regulator
MVYTAPMIDPHHDRPLYQQLADVLRNQIEHQVYGPGTALPSEAELCYRYGVGRTTVRRALAVLRAEGSIVTKRGVPSIVRQRTNRVEVVLHASDRVVARMPTSPERVALGIEAGVPLLEVRYANGKLDLLLGDRVEIVVR